MATTEHISLLSQFDEDGNRKLIYPVTSTEAVDGLEEFVKDNSPQRGEDYWTEADKNEIVNEVLEQIPGSGGNVAYDKPQNLTDEQKAQARENIGIDGGRWEVGKNKFDVSATTDGYYTTYYNVDMSGRLSTLTAHAEYSTSDWINVEEGESYVFSGVGSSVLDLWTHITDKDGYCVANTVFARQDVPFTIPSGGVKLRFSAKTSYIKRGTLQLEKGTRATEYEPYKKIFVGGINFSGVENYEPLLQKIDEKIGNEKFLIDKKAMFFGDSISDPNYDYHEWIDIVAEKTGLGVMGNFAVSAATLSYAGDTAPAGELTTTVPNQIQYMLDNVESYETPDIIFIFAGTNSGIGEIVAYDDEQFTCELNSCNLKTYSGAMRWIYEKIMNQFPNSTIVFIVPIQAAEGRRTYTLLNTKRKAIIENCDRLALDYIDTFRQSGICGIYEVDGSNGKYLIDGLHPNADGREKIADCVTNGIKSIAYKMMR